uniref:Uncharacterized protein n=1 Tax=Acidianus hospitalis (strain W1) TaxID=933801 RepID=B6D929_ACIHW|nr:hypothetical protein [Acidianus hospitalis W1]
MKLFSSILISITLILVLFFIVLQLQFSIERINGKRIDGKLGCLR